MQKTNKILLIAGGVLLLGALIHQRKNVKKGIMGLVEKTKLQNPSEVEIKNAFTKLAENYGLPIAKAVEKIFRLETRHFASSQFRVAFSAGMLKFGSVFPYGWGRQLKLWTLYPELAPDGTYTIYVKVLPDGRGVISSTPKEGYKKYVYLTFPSIYAGLAAVAENIKSRGNAESWNSNDPKEQKVYLSRLNTISNRYV